MVFNVCCSKKNIKLKIYSVIFDNSSHFLYIYSKLMMTDIMNKLETRNNIQLFLLLLKTYNLD